jgi:AcrR family transcriptional regulator
MAHKFNSRSRSPVRRPKSVKKQAKSRTSENKKRVSAHIREPPPPSERRRPRQSRAWDTTNAIVDAAEYLLVEVGYARASTNAIARRAGVSVGSLYQYFADKEAVFRAVVARHGQEIKPEIEQALQRLELPGADLVDETLCLLRRLAHINSTKPQLLEAIERELGHLGHELEVRTRVIDRVRPIVARQLGFAAEDLEVRVTLLVETITHLSRWLIHSKPKDLPVEPFVAATGRMLGALLGTRRTARRA